MLHIFPPEFEEFARINAYQMAGEEHEFHVWKLTENYMDLFDNWGVLEKIIKPSGTCIYTAAIHQEGFTQWICKYRSLFPSLTIVGIIAHGAKEFQPYSLLGCLRFCKEEEAQVKVFIGTDHEDKLEYYQNSIGFSTHFPVTVLDAKLVSQKKTEEPNTAKVVTTQDPHAPKKNTIEKAVSPTSGEFFISNRNGGIDEVVARGEIWEDWEEGSPHSVTNAHWAGFPIYMNPGDLLLIGNIIQWWKPQVIVELNAWKLGVTSFLLQMTEGMGTKIAAINQPVCAEKDGAWAKKLIEERPGARERVNLLHVLPDDSKGVLDPYSGKENERMLFLINYHSMKELIGCARMIFKHTPKRSIAMFHATTNRDVPKFLKDFRRKPGVHSVNTRFNPPGGSWYQGGVFTFDREESEATGGSPAQDGGVY